MRKAVEILDGTSPLPETWSDPSIIEDTIIADGVELHRAGLTSKGPEGEEVLGAAAEVGKSPLRRAYFELLERACGADAMRARKASYELVTATGERMRSCEGDEVFPSNHEPARFVHSRSNGMAIQVDFPTACARALAELAERDRVLRSWYGEIRPVRLDLDVASTPFHSATRYVVEAYAFPPGERTEFARNIQVVGVFGFPTDVEAPLFFGYGASTERGHALEGAVREAMQLLAFLWGESIPESPPDFAPNPMFHLEWFQYPKHQPLLREWLSGEHVQYGDLIPRASESPSEVGFVDLSPSWLRGARVAKAVCQSAMPLIFGHSPGANHLPRPLRVHPVS